MRLTRDGKMIVSHDNRLDRITEAPEGLTVDGCFRTQLWSGLYTAETVERLHAEGIGVNLFHAETPEEYAAAVSLGIDAILSNNADLAVGFLRRGS